MDAVATEGTMSKKWYNYFVSVDGSADDSTPSPGAADVSNRAAQSVAEIASTVAAEPKFTSPVSDPSSFDEIYKAAEIPEAPQGYSILKVAHMLESEHIRTLPSDVKKSSVLVALEAAGADIKDVIQDAVRRDRALDTYERVQQRAVDELENGKNKENAEIQAQIDKYLTEQRAKIQANDDEVTREKERFTGWRLKKQQEEKRIADAVGYFVSQNPITTGPVQAQPPVSKTAQRS
jgi:Asp-tRNA(Asn)/Glu-tRNA(Gln) amidotransferase A subunit family amidase